MAKKKKPILSARDRLNTIIKNSNNAKVGTTKTTLRPEVISTKPTLKPTLKQDVIKAKPTYNPTATKHSRAWTTNEKPSVTEWLSNVTGRASNTMHKTVDWMGGTGSRINEKIVKPIAKIQNEHDEKNKNKTAEERRKEMFDQYSK